MINVMLYGQNMRQYITNINPWQTFVTEYDIKEGQIILTFDMSFDTPNE